MKRLLVLTALAVVAGAASANKTVRVSAAGETVGGFSVLAGTDYAVSGNGISTSTGSFVAENALANDVHLSFKMADFPKSATVTNWGIVFNGSYENGKLSGDLVRPFYPDVSTGWIQDWYLEFGSLKNGVYSHTMDAMLQFSSAAGNFELFSSDGYLAVRLDGWDVIASELVNYTGKTYLWSDGVACDFQNISIDTMAYGIGNAAYRYGWGGYNHWAVTDCYTTGFGPKFTMTLPSGIDTSKVEKMTLTRITTKANSGQLATVKVNNVTMTDKWLNAMGGDWYTATRYDIPKSAVPNDGVVNVEIIADESDFWIQNLQLLYTVGGKEYVADHIITGNDESEAAHNYDKTASNWRGWQNYFIDVNNGGYAQMSNYPGHKAKHIVAPVNQSGPALNLVKVTRANETVDFRDVIFEPSAFVAYNELWFNGGDFPATKVGDASYDFPNTSISTTYYLDYFITGLDYSYGAESLKFTYQGAVNVTAYVLDKQAVIDFASGFISGTESFAGKTQMEKELAWEVQRAAYEALDKDEQDFFKNNEDSNETIASALARYNCIKGRGYANIDDFLFGTQPNSFIDLGGVNAPATAIVGIAFFGLLAASLAAVLLKRKRQ